MTNGVKKAIWRNFLFNLLLIAGCSIPLFFDKSEGIFAWILLALIILGFAFILQIFYAILYFNDPATKERGQGMFISLGLILLIGGIVCTAPLLIGFGICTAL